MSVIVRNSLAERILRVSKKLNVSRVTTENIVKEFLKDVQDSAERGEDILIPGVFTIRMINDEVNGCVIARGRVSNVLRDKLKDVPQVKVKE